MTEYCEHGFAPDRSCPACEAPTPTTESVYEQRSTWSSASQTRWKPIGELDPRGFWLGRPNFSHWDVPPAGQIKWR
jgi:hypothetical protein